MSFRDTESLSHSFKVLAELVGFVKWWRFIWMGWCDPKEGFLVFVISIKLNFLNSLFEKMSGSAFIIIIKKMFSTDISGLIPSLLLR